MTTHTTLTIVGNLTTDPELTFVPSGDAVVNFTVASTPRYYDRNAGEWRDGEALFMRCSQWRQPAENVAESLTRGSRVVVTGALKKRSFTTPEGEKRTVVELEADEVAVSLRFATATITRNRSNVTSLTRRRATSRNGFGQPASTDPASDSAASQTTADDPWAAPAFAAAAAGGDDPGF
ncbi:single-stranded DNA-binding protein [Nocardia sp. CDC159]|uniref:Single-stranded DNA-binding protein n=1 Tax=Nocardia pulmonis TaxID=2951408 RepID=A0A9X2EAI7_9NOCA|nr:MULTISPECIES: single-stranded DNA-binding protein [Nocardia]MCM6774523.1 single-stranded DNA-binding protein [Nocardia pulmonis]MCM6787411.1 single-stranded DNA-binding protein [Nocardia sp. CDC159]